VSDPIKKGRLQAAYGSASLTSQRRANLCTATEIRSGDPTIGSARQR